MSGLSIGYDDLQSEVASFLGYDPNDLDQYETAEVDRYIQSGIRQFYYPPAMQGVPAGFEWSFLRPTTTLDTVADQGKNDLPDDLGRVLDKFYFGNEQFKAPIPQVSEARLQGLLQRSTDTGTPQVAAVRYKEQVTGEEQKLEVAWWPIPDAVYTLTYRYEAYNGKIDSSTNPYPLGGMRYAEVITESCLAIAEQRANDEKGLHTDGFYRMLVAAVAQDNKQGAKVYGNMSPGGGTVIPRHGATGSSYPITYKGETW